VIDLKFLPNLLFLMFHLNHLYLKYQMFLMNHLYLKFLKNLKFPLNLLFR
jgi:hypothetical protein